MNTPLEDQVHDALHRRADPIQHAPLTVTDVRHRARRIQRRRAAVAGVAVAAVLAIAIPVGLSATGPSQRSDVPPATQTPSPTPEGPRARSRSTRASRVVEESPVPLLDVDGPSLITPDGTLDLPEVFDTLTPYLDGYVGVGRQRRARRAVAPSSSWAPTSASTTAATPRAVWSSSPDGGRIAWSEYDGTRWRVVVADPAGETEWVQTTFPPTAEEEPVIPVGFVSADTVAVKAMYNIGDTKTFVAGCGQPVEVPGLLQADTASPSPGVVAGITEFRAEGTCFGVVDAVAGGDPPGRPATTGSARSAPAAPT